MKLGELRAFAIAMLLPIAACGTGPEANFGSANSVPQQRTVRFTQGISMTAPQGYCARPDLKQDRGQAAFAAFSPCDGLGNNFLTVSLMEGTLGAAEALPDPAGKNDRVLGRDERSNMTMVKIENPSFTRPQGVDDKFWRAIGHNGTHFILVNLYNKVGRSISQRTATTTIMAAFDGVTVQKTDAQPVSLDKPVTKPKYRR